MRDRSVRGFTLLESVVALTIVGLAAVSALSAVGAQVRTAQRARNTLEAQSLATQQLALMRLLTAEELENVPDSLASGQFPQPFNAYQWNATSSPVKNEENLSDVTVNVEWQDGSYTLRSRIFARPSIERELPRRRS